MKVSEAFLVNTKNFESIIDTLVQYDIEGAPINSALLEELGFSDPNDLLVVRILKDFNIIDNDGNPAKYYDEFHNPETTKKALAKGLISAYETVFDQYPNIYQASFDKIKEAFEDIFEGRKTELIIKYISGTFHKIVSYVGVSTIDKALSNMEEEAEPEEETAAVEAGKSMTVQNKNGVLNGSDDKSAPSNEEINDDSINKLIDNFESKKSGDSSDEGEESDSTVQEFVKDNTDKENESVNESSTGERESETKDKNIDVDPVDLDIPLSTATQTTNTMENITAEHDFVQKALLRKSDLLQKMKRWEDLVPTLEEIINRYDNDDHKDLSEAVSRSLIRRATALLKLNRTEEALPALNTVINRLKDSGKKEFFDQASRAMLYKANILENNGNGELLPLYNRIIERLDSSSEILMKEKLDEIHLKRFDLIVEDGENPEKLDACTKLIERFKDGNEHREYLQKAMIIRAEMLDEMGQDEEALAAYDEFLTAFGS